MFAQCLRKLAFLLFLGWHLGLHAATVNTLYEVDLPAQEGSPVAAVAEEGLKMVARRLAGEMKALEAAQILTPHLDSMLKTYRIEQGVIHLLYNEALIEKTLEKAHISYWGSNRPVLLLWIEDPSELPPDSLTRWQAEANRLGIPVVVPLIDLEALASTDENALKARYGADAIWQGRVSEKEGHWQFSWRLNLPQEQLSWQVNSNSLDQAFSKSLQLLEESLRQRYVSENMVFAKEAGKNTLEVQNVNSVQDLATMLTALKKVHGLKNVQLETLLPNGTVKVRYQVAKGVQLDRLLSLDSRWVSLGDRRYRWEGTHEK